MSRSPRNSVGPVWLFIPILAVVAGAVFWLRRPQPSHHISAPLIADPDGPVAAFGGRLEGDLGTALAVRLAPLHADPERQAFETRALAARLGLGSGAPWRLSLRWDGGALEAEGAVLHLGQVEVVDAMGVALRPIGAREDPAPDPLRALFAAPSGTLGPGEQVDWILWGRRPGPEAYLAGLLPAGVQSEELARRTGLGGRLDLLARTVRRSELMLPVARLDRLPAEPEPEPATAAE